MVDDGDDGDDGDEHRMGGGEDEEMYSSCIHLSGEDGIKFSNVYCTACAFCEAIEPPECLLAAIDTCVVRHWTKHALLRLIFVR